MLSKIAQLIICIILVTHATISGVSAAVPDLRGIWDSEANGEKGITEITQQNGAEFSGTVHGKPMTLGKLKEYLVTFTCDASGNRQDYKALLTKMPNGKYSMAGFYKTNGLGASVYTAKKRDSVSQVADKAPAPIPPPATKPAQKPTNGPPANQPNTPVADTGPYVEQTTKLAPLTVMVTKMQAPLLTVRRELGDTRIAGPDSMKPIVDKTTVTAIAIKTLPTDMQNEYAQAGANQQLILSDRIYQISAGDQQGWLGGTVVMELPIPAELASQITGTNVGALCLLPGGSIYARGVLIRNRNVVQVATNHFSNWCFGLFGGKSELQQYIEDEAARRVGMRRTGFDQRFIDLGARYIEALGGISDESKAKIMKQLLSHREEINTIAISAGSENNGMMTKGCGDLIGKLIIDNLDESAISTVLKGVVGNLDLLKVTVNELNAAQQEETYDVAVSKIGEAFLRNEPVAKLTQMAIDTASLGCEALHDAAWREAYLAYRDGASRILWIGGGKVDAGDWQVIRERYSRPMVAYLRQKQPSLTEEEALTMAKKMMDDRKAQEEAIAKEEDKLRVLHETFVNYSQRSELNQQTGLKGDMAQFIDYSNRVRRIEADLASYGISGAVFSKKGLRSDAMKLMHGFALGGEAGYCKALNEIRAAVSKKLRLPGGEEIDLAKLKWTVDDWYDAQKTQPKSRMAQITNLSFLEKFAKDGSLERRYIDTRKGDPIQYSYWFYPNGVLRASSQSSSSKGVFGTETGFYENGRMKYIYTYHTFKKQSTGYDYRDDGSLMCEKTLDINGYGKAKWYTPDGRVYQSDTIAKYTSTPTELIKYEDR
ncbi:MAG: toxin-antitoxin system YwqK family antitoxin [Armatimonadota bacterium]